MIASALIAFLVIASTAASTFPLHIAPTIRDALRRQGLSSSDARMIYKMGAPIMINPISVNLVYYGNWTLNQKSIIEDFIHGIGKSDWWKTERKYYFQANASAPRYHISDQVTLGTTVDDNYSMGKSLLGNNITDIIQKYINDGTFAASTDTIYFVLTAGDVQESSSDSTGNYGFCSAYCGYHSSWKANNQPELYFSMAGNPSGCLNTCGTQLNSELSPNGDLAIDAMLSVIAHEIAETASDPSQITAWMDTDSQENCDKCAHRFGNTTIDANGANFNMGWKNRKFLIQMNWDLESTECVVGSPGYTPPSLPPKTTTSVLPKTTTSVLPETTISVLPKTTASVLSKTTASALPKTTISVLPKTTTSVLSKTTTSALPETTTSVLPKTTISVLPKTTISVLPETTISVLPETTASVLSKTTASALPETTTSVLPETTISVLPKTTTSALPETTTSVLPKTTASVLPKTTISVLPETTTSVLPKTTLHSTHTPRSTKTGSHSTHTPRSTKTGSHSRHTPRSTKTGSHSRHTPRSTKTGLHSRHTPRSTKTGSHSTHTPRSTKTGSHSRHTPRSTKTGSHSRHTPTIHKNWFA
ncbi:hypothetical protein BDEG_26699 [Batrachochytrium dendrobatidis JEL423]|uniref:Uncharacterized protein n=1 Tax=Batrachochytrium dendrobatidis (strain JEL423) TaxID=403673 RepID=A0A177WTV6_BATDL|nr:hypothetical protein BDEG_26699 [Batrachochytrium dendrobatidis JEL423]